MPDEGPRDPGEFFAMIDDIAPVGLFTAMGDLSPSRAMSATSERCDHGNCPGDLDD